MQLGRFHFGYNATVDKGRRQSPQTRRQAEHRTLTKSKRNKLTATTQDQIRNHSLPAWMVRKHLDYVSRFHFSFRSDFEDLNTTVDRIFEWHRSPENFDYFGKFGRDEMFRFFEMEKIVGGDAGIIKLKGNKLQAVESDLMTNGTGAPENVNSEGLILNKMGKVIKRAVCNRGEAGNTVEWDHNEKTENVIFGAYWSRFGSQNRGVSPLSTAINNIQDIYEGLEYNQLKIKAHAIFGLAIMRKSVDGTMGGASGARNELSGDDEEDNKTGSQFDFNVSKMNILDLADDEDIKVLESSTPSNEFVNGTYLFIQIAMLALDIPITMFDSRRSSFSGRIADINEYEVSARHKQDKNRWARKNYSDWLLRNMWNSNEFNLRSTAERNGMTLRDVQMLVTWTPSGVPWLDKLKQLQGDKLAISMLIDNPIDSAKRRGQDVFENIDKTKKVMDYCEKMEVPFNFSTVQDRTAEEVENAEDAGAISNKQSTEGASDE